VYAIADTGKQEAAIAERERTWQIFLENRQVVVESLKQGDCTGILPAARGFLDGFAGFLLEAGLLEALEQFPDHRQRRAIPIFFFCNSLVYRPLFRLERLAPIERTLFRSPYILRQMGFNALQIQEGFYHTPEGQRPFTVEATAECFAEATAEDFVTHQRLVMKALVTYCPGQFRRKLWVMDSLWFRVPRGAHTEALSFKVCVWGYGRRVWSGLCCGRLFRTRRMRRWWAKGSSRWRRKCWAGASFAIY